MRTHRGWAAAPSAVLVVASGTAQATARIAPAGPTGPADGDVLRAEPADFSLDPTKLVRAPATAHHVLCRSTDTHDRPVDVGTVLTPRTGPGPRPVVGHAPGTQGVGDECAPSRQLAVGSEYEGLGTPGAHAYVNRAAEPHGTYAPELEVRGAYAGAAPADLGAVARNLDGQHAAGFLGHSLLSLDAAYPEPDIPAVPNGAGRELPAQVEHQCTGEAIIARAFRKSVDLTADGRPPTAYLTEEPYASRVEEQRIGVRRPDVPVFVVHSALDDIVPYEQGAEMARRWCRLGANVRFGTSPVPTHAAAMAAAYPEAFAWLEARSAGIPARGAC